MLLLNNLLNCQNYFLKKDSNKFILKFTFIDLILDNLVYLISLQNNRNDSSTPHKRGNAMNDEFIVLHYLYSVVLY